MLVIGIDPGTASTGYGLVGQQADGSLQCVAYGLISTKPRRPQERRLQTLYLALCRILEEYDPQEAAVEKLFFQRNVTTAISVGQARGVALLALAQAGLPVAEYNPQEVKQAVSGYGGADKRQMQHMVQRLLGLASLPKPDDAADALAVAICHLHSRVLRPIQDER
jgi:crossover junction endodeoxyribonuclease RuvC